MDEKRSDENKNKPQGSVAGIAMIVCVTGAVVVFVGGANMWTAIAVTAMAAMGAVMSFLLLRSK